MYNTEPQFETATEYIIAFFVCLAILIVLALGLKSMYKNQDEAFLQECTKLYSNEECKLRIHEAHISRRR